VIEIGHGSIADSGDALGAAPSMVASVGLAIVIPVAASCPLAIAVAGPAVCQLAITIPSPAVCPLAVSIISPLVFAASGGYSAWTPVVVINGTNVSARLTGRIDVNAAEDSARTASLAIVPATAADLDGYEGQGITIDATLFRTGQTATVRLFTGVVERVEFATFSRVASLACRDGYQERPGACTSAADVEALFSGGAFASSMLLPWDAAKPDPESYFSGLLATFPGAVAIDSSGLWQAIPWTIGSPSATFGAGDVIDGSVSYKTPARADLPQDIHAALVVRGSRLHAAEVALYWQALPYSHYIIDGIPRLPKTVISDAMSRISEWLPKRAPVLTGPTPGVYGPISGGYAVVTHNDEALYCERFTGTYYRRWYQEAEVSYTVTIPMGGLSNRDESIRERITSTFDAASWERTPTSEADNGLYTANAPAVNVALTGYEGLPAPWPPTNGAMDHLPDVLPSDLQDAANFVVAKALRRAASGRRKRQVGFARPLDARWEIGDVLAVNAMSIAATGQVVEIAHSLDINSGSAESNFVLAVPEGNSTTTDFTAGVVAPSCAVAHTLTAPTLGNWVGASYNTILPIVEANLLGFLFNCDPLGNNYDASKTAFLTQFRVIMPAIPAPDRDPITISQPMTGAVNIAAGSLAITF
jgi:hypothetical protein